MGHNKLALLIATKDRPDEIRRALESLSAQSRKPDQVIVVDGGTNRVEAEVMRFPELKPIYLRAPKPSAAGQRNLGLSAVADGCEFIGFLDDDVILDPRAIEVMMTFWDGAFDRIVGAALNLVNHPPLDWPFLKTSRLAEILGFYSFKKGAVTRSGFQTMLGTVRSVTPSEWLPTTAVVWRKGVFGSFRFDDWFDGYSYLEDLDFSYRVGKAFLLVVVPGSRYCHYPGVRGRGNGFAFGLREVRNRLHFVTKNPELSRSRCLLALSIRALLNLGLAVRRNSVFHLQRFVGNLAGLAKAVFSAKQE
jgi:GT2 family glycosyltransferase